MTGISRSHSRIRSLLGPIAGQENVQDTFQRVQRSIDPNAFTGPTGTRCIIPTHDPVALDGELTHPCVVYAPEKWNGYYYWMGITPYLNSNDSYEDPCIVASNDGINWEVPAGLTNPLDDQPGGTKYNSDTHLVFGPNNVLFLFWRFLNISGDAPGAEENIFVRTSTDGITWTPKQLVYQSDQTVRRLLSPSFEFFNNVWHMFAIDIVGTKRGVHLTSSRLTPSSWSAPEDCTITLPSGRYPWHWFVTRVGDQWVGMLNDSSNAGNSGQDGDLILMTSDIADGLSWNVAARPCVRRAGTSFTRQYRSCFIPKVVNGVWGFEAWHSVWNPKHIYRTILALPLTVDDAGYVVTSSIAAGANAAHAVTFAPGLFSEPPVVTASPTNGRLNVAIDQATLTKDGVTINAFNWTASSASAARIYWRATQR